MRIHFDPELVERCRNLDNAAIDQLFRSYEKPVFSLVYRMLGSFSDAEDATQEIFVKVIRGLPRFKSESTMTTWIYRIAMNHCLNVKRKWFNRKRDASVSLDQEREENPQYFNSLVSDSTHNPLRGAQSMEMSLQLDRALQSLPAQLKSIILLRDVEGLNYDEIADTLNISMGTVKSRISRARSALRKKLKPLLSEKTKDEPHE